MFPYPKPAPFAPVQPATAAMIRFQPAKGAAEATNHRLMKVLFPACPASFRERARINTVYGPSRQHRWQAVTSTKFNQIRILPRVRDGKPRLPEAAARNLLASGICGWLGADSLPVKLRRHTLETDRKLSDSCRDTSDAVI